jgi:hypothetical protein
VIGFGQGKTELHVFVSLDDLAQGVPKLFYEFDAGADSGKQPGGFKFAAAAKYAFAGLDLEKNVVESASVIAARITGRVVK